MEVRFVFDSLEEEIERKIESMLSDSDLFAVELMHQAKQLFGMEGEAATDATLRYAKSLPSVSEGHPMAGYMNHPIRVASYSIRMVYPPNLEIMHIGLMHNVYEVCGLSESDVESQGYSGDIAKAIRLMTIDRNLQNNVEYLTQYYGAIEEFGEGLALLKCLDKLDNMLAFQLVEDNGDKVCYLELAKRFVAPMSERLSPQLGDFCRDLIAYMNKARCRHGLREQYLNFLELSKEMNER